MSRWEKIRLYRTTDAQRDKYLKRGHPLRVADELGCKFEGGGVYVLVSGWSLAEEFGFEFKLSRREQNGLQEKKYIGREGMKTKTCGPSAGKARVHFSRPP